MDVSVSLPDNLANYVEDQLSTGRFGSWSEALSEAIRLMEAQGRENAEKLAWLRQACEEGIASGDAGPIDFDALKREARARLTGFQRGS